MRIAWCLAVAVWLHGAGHARGSPEGDAIPPFSADRPGMGVSTETVPRGFLQFESGFGLYSVQDGGAHTVTTSLGSPLLRLGVSHRMELRLEGEGYQTLSKSHGLASVHGRGWSDFSLGAKIGITGERGWMPALSLLPMLSVPAGAGQFTTDGYDPSVQVGWSRSLPAGFSLGGSVGTACLSDAAGRFWQSNATLAAGRDLTAGWKGYFETQRLSAVERHGAAEWMLGAGGARMVGRAAQVDVQIGHTVGGSRSSWFAAVGIALRGPRALFR